jgi:hypothetical protein
MLFEHANGKVHSQIILTATQIVNVNFETSSVLLNAAKKMRAFNLQKHDESEAMQES